MTVTVAVKKASVYQCNHSRPGLE
jgi:hypothetical protein